MRKCKERRKNRNVEIDEGEQGRKGGKEGSKENTTECGSTVLWID